MYTIRRRRRPNHRTCSWTYNIQSGRRFARCTTLRNAQRQMRKLRAIRYGRSRGRPWP